MGFKQTARTRILRNFAGPQMNLGTVTNLDIGNVKRRVICWQIDTILLVGGGSIPVSSKMFLGLKLLSSLK
jgi:hypothetical protein